MKPFFAPREHGSTPGREIIAGLTTFAAMAYILAVNPAILATTGMDRGALVTATALSAAVMTTLMALATRYPIALAPGMGLNAFFAFSICGAKGIPWQGALGIVFYSGILFLILSFTGLRRRVVEAIPRELKVAITGGIGFFIALLGLKNGGLVVAHPDTLVALGDLSRPAPLLVLAGIVLTAVFIARKTPGAIILVVALLTLAGAFIPGPAGTGTLTPAPAGVLQWPASLEPTFLRLDLGILWHDFFNAAPLILMLLFVTVFDNMGTLIGVSHRAGLLDAQGHLPRMDQALRADAGASIFGALIGTSPVVSYIESITGIEAGGRTGASALVVAACFLLALFFTPLILIIPPMATAPALVIVGALMMQGLSDLKTGDFSLTLPVFMTLLMMPLTFSISEGIAFGLLTFTGIRLGLGRWREVHPVIALLCLFILGELIWGRG